LFLGLLLGFICILVMVAMGVSFWVRNAPEKFQEAKMAALAGVCMFQVFFAGIPTVAAVWLDPVPRFLVLTSITFLLCMILFCTMFLPKVFKIREYQQQGRTASSRQEPADAVVENDALIENLQNRSYVRAIHSIDENEESMMENAEFDKTRVVHADTDTPLSGSFGRAIESIPSRLAMQ